MWSEIVLADNLGRMIAASWHRNIIKARRARPPAMIRCLFFFQVMSPRHCQSHLKEWAEKRHQGMITPVARRIEAVTVALFLWFSARENSKTQMFLFIRFDWMFVFARFPLHPQIQRCCLSYYNDPNLIPYTTLYFLEQVQQEYLDFNTQQGHDKVNAHF